MIVARKWTDAAAALFCGSGVIPIAIGVKDVPSVISYLGLAAYGWGALVVLSCLAAAVGAALRTRDVTKVRRRIWSVILERVAWPALGLSCLVFVVGVVDQFGYKAGALTIGWAGFVICTCAGHWLVIRRAAREVKK